VKRVFIIASLAILVILLCYFSFNVLNAQSQEIIVYRGQTLTLTATLEDDLGEPVVNETIYFYDETHNMYIGEAVTNDNGIAQISWTVPKSYSPGQLVLNATFRGNLAKNLSPSYQVFYLTVMGKTYLTILVTDTTLDPYDQTVAPGDEVVINVTVTDDVGEPVKAINVSLIEGEKIIDQQFTNEKGETVLRYIPSPKTSEGKIELTIQAGPYQYYEKSTCIIALNIRKIKTNITMLEIKPEVAYRNQTVTITGKLVDEKGDPLVNAAIYVKNEKGNVSSAWTNATGFFEAIIYIPNYTDPGEYVYTVSFAGSPRYENAERNVTLTIRGITYIDFCFSNVTVISGEITKLNVTLLDDQNDPVPFRELLVFDSQGNLLTSTITNDNGCATIQWYVSQAKGPSFITINFPGDEFYDSTMLKVPILVFERPNLVVKKENNITLVARSMQISFFVQLKTLQNDPLQGKVIHAYDITNHLYIGNVTTDDLGKATITYIIPSNAVFGQLIIKVTYLGNPEQYLLNAENYVIYRIVEKIPTELILNIPRRVKIEEIIICEVTLQTIEGMPLKFEKLSVYLNDSLLNTVKTNNDGKVIVKLKMPSEPAIIVVMFKYNGSDFYGASLKRIEIEVLPSRNIYSFLKDFLKIISIPCLLGIFIVVRKRKILEFSINI